MIIIHDVATLPRLATHAVAHGASVMPVTVVTGARQTGKSTLVRDLAAAGERLYLTLDDLDVLDQASAAPDDLVARAERLTLDEVQRAPQILLAVKRVDAHVCGGARPAPGAWRGAVVLLRAFARKQRGMQHLIFEPALP